MRKAGSPAAGSGLALPNWVVWALGVGFGLAAVVAGVVSFTAARDFAAAWEGGPGLNPFRPPAGERSGTSLEPGATPTLPLLEITPQPWNKSDRVTVLVMGLDYRDWLAGEGPPRTDTMMLLTLDPVTRTGGMLSIPRDLWVEIPGFEHNRINTAYFLGETYRLPGGGPVLAARTVENLLGVPVPYYAVVEFSAFERMIDEIGGIDVLVRERIKISPIGQDSFWLEAKAHHLNGAEALAYARARKTEGGDFDRAQRQQQVALAILDRVVGFNMVPVLLTRAPALYQELSSGIRTNLTFEEMVSLGLLAVQIPEESIRKGVIGPPDMVTLHILPDGAEVLRPVPDQIRVLRDEIFTSTGVLGPSAETTDPIAAAQQESARLAVLNGAGIEGLAGRTSAYLTSLGFNVLEVGNADRLDYAKSVIIDHTGNPYTTRYLASLMGLTESQILFQANPAGDVDVTVIVGADWLPP